jgi:hypothetical protein
VLVPDDGEDGRLDGEPDVVESDGELVGGGVAVGGGGVVCGEAEGVRSTGRSPTRSSDDSVQPATSPALAPSRISVPSNLFIPVLPNSSDVSARCNRGATHTRALIH